MMEKLKKVSRAQWCFFALLIGFAFLMQNCQDDDGIIYDESQTETELNARPVKVTVCRYNARKNTYSEVTVVDKRVLPGDVILDADGDGYVKENSCSVTGLGIDCDDTNAAINPGAVEICGDGIDNNCDGETDECTYVPDDNFEQALITYGYDDVLDNYVFNKNINTRTYLNVNYYEGTSPGKIADLTGIGGFTALEYLECKTNQLTSLNISSNTALTTLDCDYNQLTSLNLSSNTALTTLYCNYNQLESLDVSNNTALVWFSCYGNLLTSLAVSDNTALKDINCGGNQLTSLDVSNNTSLERLYIWNNEFTSIDLSKNTSLINLYADHNKLTSLDVSSNTALEILYCHYNILTSVVVGSNTNLLEFYCYNNQLTSLDVTSITNLSWLACGGNQLTSIDISYNTDLEGLWIENNLLTSLDVSQNTILTYLECFDNSALSCIQVNISQLATAPTDPNWIKDAAAVYSTNCSLE